MISLLVGSFIAGFLTILAPCILPLLPAMIGGTASDKSRSPYVTIASLLIVIAIILVTLVVQTASSFFYVSSETWEIFGGILVFFVGFAFILPHTWSRIPFVSKSAIKSNKLLASFMQLSGRKADVAIGVALAPTFTACSPTYLLIIAVIVPSAFFEGLLYLTIYVLGLGVTLIAIALLGQRVVQKLNLLSYGWFKTSIGLILIATSIVILTGFEKTIATALLDIGFFDATQLEMLLPDRGAE